MKQRIHMGAIVLREGRIMLLRPQIGAPWELPGGELQPHQEDVDEAMDAILAAMEINSPAVEEDFIETVYIPIDDGMIVYNLYAPSEWHGEPSITPGIGMGWFALEELEALVMEEAVRNAVLVAFGLREPKELRIPFLEEPLPPAAQQVPLPVDTEPPGPEPPGDTTQEPMEPEAAVPGMEGPSAPADQSVSQGVGAPPVAQPAASSSETSGIIGATVIGANDEVDSLADIPLSHAPARVRGMDVLRTLSGGEPGPAAERLRERYPELAGSIVDFALGEVWANDTLSRKERSLLVVAMLTAMGGREGPLRSHINGALNHGASPDEVVEVLRLTAVYAGFPAALEAWPTMEAIFEQRGIQRPGGPQ